MKVHVWGESGLADAVREFLKKDYVWLPDEATYHISAQYDKIFTKDELDRYGYILNIHYSDIEQLRGCNVISHAIAFGFDETAITFHVINEEIDAGNIVFKIPVPISDDETAFSLYKRCEEEAIKAFKENWFFLKTKPEGVPPKKLGEYFMRDEFEHEFRLTIEQDRFVRSRIFQNKPKPYVFYRGKKYEFS